MNKLILTEDSEDFWGLFYAMHFQEE